MSNLHVPDSWVALEVTVENQPAIRVLSGWYGGYLGSDSWRLSTNIVNMVESQSDQYSYYEFTTETGSKYHCGKENYGLTRYTADILEQLKETATETITVTLLNESEFYEKYINR